MSLASIDRETLNSALVDWKHKMGPWNRPSYREWFCGLYHHDELMAVAAAGDLIRDRCAGFTREEAIELGRLCAARPDLCRVMLRLWREFVFPELSREHGCEWAISYQDRAQHTGNLYRFDGWVRVGMSRSGTDQRSGRRGRNKAIWGWHPHAPTRTARKEVTR